MNFEQVEAQLSELPLYVYFRLKSSDLVFSDRIRWVCEHECPMYGTNWACPPAVGTVAECKARCLAFPEYLLISTVTEVADIADLEATLATRADHEAVTNQVDAILQAQGVETYVLSTESCAICKSCAYPDGPCRFPQKMHPCVESHGIVLTDTAEACGVPFQYGDNVVTWFSMIFFREKGETL